MKRISFLSFLVSHGVGGRESTPDQRGAQAARLRRRGGQPGGDRGPGGGHQHFRSRLGHRGPGSGSLAELVAHLRRVVDRTAAAAVAHLFDLVLVCRLVLALIGFSSVAPPLAPCKDVAIQFVPAEAAGRPFDQRSDAAAATGCRCR